MRLSFVQGDAVYVYGPVTAVTCSTEPSHGKHIGNAAHIVVADFHTRNFFENVNWPVEPEIFKLLGVHNIHRTGSRRIRYAFALDGNIL